MQAGDIGGTISVHPTAKIALKILGVETAKELGEVVASAGLARAVWGLKLTLVS